MYIRILGLYKDNNNTKGTSEGKLKTFIFLIHNCLNSLFRIVIETLHSINSLCRNEMNESRDKRNRNEKLGIFCYYMVLVLLVKEYSVI